MSTYRGRHKDTWPTFHRVLLTLVLIGLAVNLVLWGSVLVTGR